MTSSAANTPAVPDGTASAPAFTVLIPARLASTRLPHKPLADIAGLPMVVRVAQRVAHPQSGCGAQAVVVACDDPRIASACAEHGVQAVLTRADHASGSDRLGEACAQLGLDGDDLVVNVQGDEPLIEPALVRAVAALLQARPDCVMSTAAHAFSDAAEFASPHVVKVVLDAASRALYFSRSPLPCWRDGEGRPPQTPKPLRHIGLYGYRAGFLRGFGALAPAPIEQAESLEQLRVLWHGHRIAVHLSDTAPGPGVDTPADLERVRAVYLSTSSAGAHNAPQR